jgi:hypothetical protein
VAGNPNPQNDGDAAVPTDKRSLIAAAIYAVVMVGVLIADMMGAGRRPIVWLTLTAVLVIGGVAVWRQGAFSKRG